MTEISYKNYKLTVDQAVIDEARHEHGISIVDFFIQQIKKLPDALTMKYVRVHLKQMVASGFTKTPTPTGIEVSLEFRDQP